jgi:hypothetical protein
MRWTYSKPANKYKEKLYLEYVRNYSDYSTDLHKNKSIKGRNVL